MGWEAVAEEVALSQASSHDLVAHLVDGESPDNPVLAEERDTDPAVWWLQLLRKHADELGLGNSNWTAAEVLSCVSACSGSLAECAVFKELQIPFVCHGLSEPSAAFRSFCSMNYGGSIRHMHETMTDQVQGHACTMHPQSAECCLPHSPAFACFGTPCNPFSRQRPKRWQNGSVKEHASYDTTFKDAYAFLMRLEPKVCMMEQVEGFDAAYSVEDPETPKTRFLQGLRALNFSKGGYYVLSFRMTSKIWLKISRERCYFLFFRKDVFRPEDCVQVETTVHDILRLQAEEEPVPVESLMLSKFHDRFKIEMSLEEKSAEQAKSRRGREGGEWHKQVALWRDDLGISPSFNPFDRLGVKIQGLAETPRIRAILNLVVAQKISALKSPKKCAILEAIKDTIVDVSQNLVRRSFTPVSGVNHALTTSSYLVHLGRMSVVLPCEVMYWQGHNKDVVKFPQPHGPDAATAKDIRSLAEEGMFLPCVATLIFSLLVNGALQP